MNETHSQFNTLRDKILKKIESGEVRMTSKTYFMLRVALLIAVLFLIIAISSFVVSYILFAIHVSGKLLLLGFGLQGILVFLSTFPWGFLLIDIILLFVLEWLLRYFRFCYGRPLLYLALGIFSVTSIAGAGIYATSIHDSLFMQARDKKLPVIGGMYSGLQKTSHENGLFRGVVVEIEGNTIVMKDFDHDTPENALFLVTVSPDMANVIQIGDVVFVAGTINKDKITAFGLKKTTPYFQGN